MTRSLMVAAVLAQLMAGMPNRAVSQETVVRGYAVAGEMRLKLWVPAGSVRLRTWDLDSLHVSGTVAEGSLFVGGAGESWKLMVENPGDDMAPAELDIRLPKKAQVSVKTVTAMIIASGVSGWFNSVGGDIILDGSARRFEAETLDGDISVEGRSPWLRARSGSGSIKVEGLFRDATVASVSGGISILNKLVDRGRFESISGDIRYRGHFAPGGEVEFDSHSGAITLVLPQDVTGRFRLTSILGSIENGFSSDRPEHRPEGVGEELALSLGEVTNGIVVRSFKGTIRLRLMD